MEQQSRLRNEEDIDEKKAATKLKTCDRNIFCRAIWHNLWHRVKE